MRHHDANDVATGAVLRIARRLPQRFLVREDGSTTIFATVVFVLMIGIGGIAIDIMRFETQRVQLQYTLDRAVLAAASLSQTLDPQEVVESYFETAGLEGYRLRVDVENGINFRRVEARAEMELQTLFMSIFGQPMLTSPAAGAAEERVRNIEVSLVLDVSGSMSGSSRMTNLRPAARSFVTSVLEANNNPLGDQLVSVSIVPYDHAVNMGTTLSSVFSLTGEHTYSRCARFQAADYTFAGINPTVPLQRMADIDVDTTNSTNPTPQPACHRDNTAAVIPWSNNETQLHNLINSLEPRGWTAIDQGMRWAVALLDPAARPALSGLVSNGSVHPDFDGRPASYVDPETMKIIVLMTDGENTRQWDVQEQFRSGPSPFWRNPADGRWSVFYPQWNLYWQESRDRWRSTPDGGANAVQLDYADLWHHVSVRSLRSRMFHSHAWERHEGYTSSVNHWRRTTVQAMQQQFNYWNVVNQYAGDNGVEGDARLRAICDVAHAQGITVFSIAFEAPWRGQQVMRYCASSAAHYYDVNGIDISNAFASIARTINQLRLIQ
ncbi:TadE/TadG family type IV pilus assembly protein [Roseicyclus mahoneyensis]|uniref:Flp pilus assembly protein TadG n=1 Tax=Roseicyclus mahoneyensis TaxID=164332 RepID=A0A316H0I1_9RHOB|nr:pilus assembly protein TadG-related protein [Roseicyclus mahoneyensis]PWK60910.1 Flp pilus assembly protein TadG [Roseicyclus mahoneyensis]